jgi:hypothetical protein
VQQAAADSSHQQQQQQQQQATAGSSSWSIKCVVSQACAGRHLSPAFLAALPLATSWPLVGPSGKPLRMACIWTDRLL